MSDKLNIKDIQSAIIYNRANGNDNFIGVAIELYNRSNDPNLETPLSSTNVITTAEDVYRFDYPAIDTYPSGDFSDTDSITQIASETLALKEVVSEFADSANITGGLSVDTITLPIIGDVETSIQGKQDEITTDTDLSCNSLNTNQLIVNDDLYFNTIVIRRPNEVITTDTSVPNAGSINIRELQCWVNDVNILASNSGSLNSYYAYWSDKENDIGQHLTLVSEFAYNDIIGSDITGSPENSATDFALIIKNVPKSSINTIQSFIYYNRVHNTWGQRAIGLAVEFYNIDNDPNLERPLATTTEITTAEDVYRYDFPAIDTYTGGFSDTDSIYQIASEELALKEVVSEFAESANITGGLKVDTITTTGNVDVGGLILAPNQVSFKAGRTTSQSAINTSIVLPFDNVIYNIGDAYDNSTYEFTAPVSGIYFFYSQFFTAGDTAYGVDFLLDDGSETDTILYRIERPSTGAGGTTYLPMSFITQLNSGDKVYMKRVSGIINLPLYPYSQWGGHLLALKNISLNYYLVI